MSLIKFSSDWSSNVRSYQVIDKGALETVINAVCAEGRWMRTTHFEPTPAWEHALTEPDCPDHLLLVAHAEERPIGWCRAFPTNVPGEAKVGIGLLPPYRDRGLGTSMLRRSLDWAGEQELTRLTLTTRDDNHRAIHVFEKCGFSPTGWREGKWIEMEYLRRDTETRRHCCE